MFSKKKITLAYTIEKQQITATSTVNVDMAKGGGFAISLLKQ